MTRTPAPVVIRGFHNSGRWDRSDELLEANVHRMRRGGRSFGTRTEMHSRDFTDELHWPDDGWGHYQAKTPWGPSNCTVEWDRDVWRKVEADWTQLTEFRAETKSGHLNPPSVMVRVVLEHLATGVEVEVSAQHMNLHNTPARAAAWFDEAHVCRAHWRASRRQHPRRELVNQSDVNRTQRLARNRRLVETHMLAGTGMSTLWRPPLPDAGTHGRALLDTGCSTMRGRLTLLPDDPSSDHRPFESVYELNPRRAA